MSQANHRIAVNLIAVQFLRMRFPMREPKCAEWFVPGPGFHGKPDTMTPNVLRTANLLGGRCTATIRATLGRDGGDLARHRKDREEKLDNGASTAEPPGSGGNGGTEISGKLAQMPGAMQVGTAVDGAPGAGAVGLVGANGRGARAAELEVQGICKSFGAVQVLRDVSFTVRHGEFITLLGPSGCGKTTLLRILAGLEQADAGDVELLGKKILSLPANKRPVNTVFQSYALFPHLNVFENVAFGLRARSFVNAEVNRRVTGALDMLQLEEYPKRYPHQLSGGQKQRVALARALVNEPELLLLDEPMSALDAKLRAEVQLDLRRLQRRLGKTFILVTHDQDEAMTVSDRILVMNQGTIEQAGVPSEVYEHPVNRFVAQFLGAANLIDGERVKTGVKTALGTLRVRHTPAWEKGTLAIRPERVRVAKGNPENNGIYAEVHELIFRGDHFEVFVEPGPLRLKVPPGVQLKVGQKVWLELPLEHLEVLSD